MGRVKKRTKEFERRRRKRRRRRREGVGEKKREEKRRKFLGHITSFTQQRVCRARPIEVA